MCLVAFQKIFRKIFSDVWKRRRKRQTQEKYHQQSRSEIAILPVRARDRRGVSSRWRDLANDASRARVVAISRLTRREIAPLIAISVEGEITINCAISRWREIAPSIAIFAAIVGLEIGAAWSSESVGDRRTDCSVSSPLARARALSLSLSLSLSFRKCFEVKMRGENHFRVKGENIGQPEVIFRKISFSVTAKHAEKGENDFLKSFSPKTNAP